ncbi:putative transmembrane protein [Leptomonas seymouri]|uniref:Putative transmembrane protein n=1 Tax=Leptomonas seymouri TaxID=5684 RepID=A0A0N0P3L3_LEPSE|nr:putative transmembrane protein [Leptomonas seymouri]|eukprot:KPI84259.1 putative transmembrane protein [Leptomonas seymouri]
MGRARALLHLFACLCCIGILRSSAQQVDFNAARFPFNKSVQSFVAPALAMGIGPIGGRAYLSTAANTSTVCASHNTRALITPVTATAIDELFYSLGGSDIHLDVTHACYMNVTQYPPQCVASLTSTATDCGGVTADALGPLLNSTSSSTGVVTSSAAVLASYIQNGAAQRLKLERSLRRTREVVSALIHAHDLVLKANGTTSDEGVMQLLRGRATQHVKEVVNAAYKRVIEKYYVLDMWTNLSLGIATRDLSSAAGPAAGVCDVHDYIHRLLWGTEAPAAVLLAITQKTLNIADRIRRKEYSSAVRGVQCAQVLTALTMMTLEDYAVRRVAAMIADKTLNASSVWSISDFELLLPSQTTALRMRQLWSLDHVFAAVRDLNVADDTAGGAAVAACMRRAAFALPDPTTGRAPPSISWCMDNTSMNELASTNVNERSLAVHESDTAANGQCLWGFSMWNGLCDGAAFDPARCQSCPPGSVGDGEGYCVCGNATATYATLTSGCMTKGAAHDAAGVRHLQPNGNVSLSGNATVALLSVQLPQTTVLSDPSAFLRANVTCINGEGGGGTRLLATPQGSRRAPCDSVVVYERHAERTGVLNTVNGQQFFETYAENLTISVLGSAAFVGETCRIEVGVQSALYQASRSVVVGTWTFVPAAEVFVLDARSYTGDIPTNSTAAPDDLPLCSPPSSSASDSGEPESIPVMRAGVCRTNKDGPAIFVHPGSYSAFGTSTHQAVGERIRSSAGASRDASFMATMQSLARNTGIQLLVEGATNSAVLWSAIWELNATPLAANAWASGWVVPIESNVLRNMRSLRLRVADTSSTSAFMASEATAECRYGNDADEPDSSSAYDGKEDVSVPMVPRAHYGFWYVVLIIIVSILDAVVLPAFGFLVFLLYNSLDKWPMFLH